MHCCCLFIDLVKSRRFVHNCVLVADCENLIYFNMMSNSCLAALLVMYVVCKEKLQTKTGVRSIIKYVSERSFYVLIGYRRQSNDCLSPFFLSLANIPLSPETAQDQERRIRREIANSNERRRMQSINAGFQSLKTLLPHTDGEKLSKVQKRCLRL